MKSLTQILVTIVVTLVLHAGAYAGFHFYENQLAKSHVIEVQGLQSQWAKEDQQRDQERRKTLDQSYGASPVERKFYNPEVGIAEFLGFLAKQYAPRTTTASAEVDRFTEFSVYLVAIQMPSLEERAEYLKSIFSWVDPAQVFQVVFVEEDGPIAVAEQSCLLQIKNWPQTSHAKIAQACFK